MRRNDFHSDDTFQRDARDRLLIPLFYQKREPGQFVLMDKGRLSTFMQRRMAVDTIAQGKNGEAVSIEEKIVRWPGYHYTSFCLETESCTVPGHESPGWMAYGEADYLLYCFAQDDPVSALDCHLIDFQALKPWFWERESGFQTFQMPTRNRTRGRKVPIAAVSAAVPTWRFILCDDERAAA